MLCRNRFFDNYVLSAENNFCGKTESGLKKIFIPLLVELLILFDVCLFTFLFLRLLIEHEFLLGSHVVLTLELSNSILSHFSFDVLALLFALMLMLFKHHNEFADVLSIGFVMNIDLVTFHGCSMYFVDYNK